MGIATPANGGSGELNSYFVQILFGERRTLDDHDLVYDSALGALSGHYIVGTD